MAAYMALLEPGDTILGMELAHGGHLTPRHEAERLRQALQVVATTCAARTSASTWTRSRSLAEEHKPKLIVAGWSAYPRQLDFAAFREIADSVGAKLMVDMAHFAGLVAAGEHPSPVPHADVVTTTTHKTLRGPRSGMILCKEEHAKAIDKAVFPGQQGGPLMHIDRRQGRRPADRRQRAFRDRQRQTIANAQAFAEGCKRAASRRAHRRHRRPPRARRPRPSTASTARRRGPARGGRHHRQPQRDPLRRAAADEPLRPAHRHAGADHPRHGRGRPARDRPR